jgi:hypothetical protein
MIGSAVVRQQCLEPLQEAMLHLAIAQLALGVDLLV